MTVTKALVIADYYPMPDRSSGDLRFFTILKILSEQWNLVFCAYDEDSQRQEVGGSAVEEYRQNIESIGVTIDSNSIESALKMERFDIVFFEFYYAARTNIDNVRLYQPQAKIVVDSVDVHFKRLLAKAKLSRLDKDFALASRVRDEELNTYMKSDFVVVVTKDDQAVLEDSIEGVRCILLPNIHQVPACSERTQVDDATLLFVGGFGHEPNLDAVKYLCMDIFPKILDMVPQAKLNIIGASPPESIQRFSSKQVSVLGYIPDIAPYYQHATVSVAPLRFGGGMKGKVGEAMAYTVPVVTTSFGAEGFDLRKGKDLIVADNTDAFAEKVVRLLTDLDFNKCIARSGWRFIHGNYSYDAVARKVIDSFEGVMQTTPKRLPLWDVMRIRLVKFYLTHLKWRLVR